MKTLFRCFTVVLALLAFVPASQLPAEVGDRECMDCFCGDDYCEVIGWEETETGYLMGGPWTNEVSCTEPRAECAEWEAGGDGGGAN